MHVDELERLMVSLMNMMLMMMIPMEFSDKAGIHNGMA